MTLSFAKGSMLYGEKKVPAAVFTCVDCGAEHKERLISGSQMNPEAIAQRARNHGWEAHHERASRTRCPACITARRVAAAGESPNIKTEEAPVAASPPTNVTPIAPEAREPTPTQKLQIRGHLDRFFDDEKGMYLDGYSDEKIGKELNLPWAWVARIREAAYGSIRVDPEIVGLRAEITGLKAKLAAETKAFGDRIAEAEKRLEALSARRKAG